MSIKMYAIYELLYITVAPTNTIEVDQLRKQYIRMIAVV